MNNVLSNKFKPSLTIDEFLPECKAFAEPYSCPLCEGILYESVIDKCGHTYCQSCINKLLKSTKNCPFSNEIINLPLPMNIVVNTMLEKQNVYCKNKDKECQWTGKLMDRKNHLQYECPKEILSCEFAPDCDLKDSREKILEHVKVCPFRLIQCEYCEETISFNNLENHNKICPNIPIECTNKCGKKIPLNKIKYHLEEECDMTVIECPFTMVGCEFYDQRLKLKQHLDTDLERHLRMITTKISILEKKINESNNVIEKLKIEKNDLQNNMNDIFEKINNNNQNLCGNINNVLINLNSHKNYCTIPISNFVPNFYDMNLTDINIFDLNKENFIIKKKLKNYGWYGINSECLYNFPSNSSKLNECKSSMISFTNDSNIIINMKIKNTINSCIFFGITWSELKVPLEKGFYSQTNEKDKSLMFYCFNKNIYYKGVVMVNNNKETKCYDNEIITLFIKTSKDSVLFYKNGKPLNEPIIIPGLSKSKIRAAVDLCDYEDEVEFLN